jgi:flagellar biosynthesis protein FlhF
MEQDNSSMRIKSYFAASVEQAIQEARQELGQEAMLITSRRSAPEARHLGAYEVVFGVAANVAAPAAQARSKPKTAARPNTPPPATELNAELQSLRAQLEDIKQTLQLGAGAKQPVPAASESENLYAELVSLDLAPAVAREITADALALRERAPQAGQPLRQLAAESIAAKIRCAEGTTREPLQTGGVLAVAGPAGVGKTTTLVKIAVREVLARRLPLRIVSVDFHRVAAQEKLRTLSGILGAAFVAATTVSEFQEALKDAHRKHVVLIDTPAFDRSEPEPAQEIAGYLEKISRKELHLVLPASMKRADLVGCVQQYAVFQPDYLLFTKLDETASHGALISTALQTGRPLSFLTAGQGIPEDLEPASTERLLANYLPRPAAEAVSAA